MDVVETIGRAKREVVISASEADAMVTLYEGDLCYSVRRYWDAVSFTVSIAVKGETWPFLSYSTGLAD